MSAAAVIAPRIPHRAAVVMPWVRSPRQTDALATLTPAERETWDHVNSAIQTRTRDGRISVPELARAAHRTERQIYRRLEGITGKGLLYAISDPGRKSKYYLPWEYPGPRVTALTPDIGTTPTPDMDVTPTPDIRVRGAINTARASEQTTTETKTTTAAAVKTTSAVAVAAADSLKEPLRMPDPEAVEALKCYGIVEKTAKQLATKPRSAVFHAIRKAESSGCKPEHMPGRIVDSLTRPKDWSDVWADYRPASQPEPRPRREPTPPREPATQVRVAMAGPEVSYRDQSAYGEWSDGEVIRQFTAIPPAELAADVTRRAKSLASQKWYSHMTPPELRRNAEVEIQREIRERLPSFDAWSAQILTK